MHKEPKQKRRPYNRRLDDIVFLVRDMLNNPAYSEWSASTIVDRAFDIQRHIELRAEREGRFTEGE